MTSKRNICFSLFLCLCYTFNMLHLFCTRSISKGTMCPNFSLTQCKYHSWKINISGASCINYTASSNRLLSYLIFAIIFHYIEKIRYIVYKDTYISVFFSLFHSPLKEIYTCISCLKLQFIIFKQTYLYGKLIVNILCLKSFSNYYFYSHA